MTPEQVAYWAGVLVGGLFVGAVCGLLPLAVAKRKGRTAFGVASLVACTLSGLLLGLILAVPVAVILSAVALILGSPAGSSSARLETSSRDIDL
jgi:hypothetical protein